MGDARATDATNVKRRCKEEEPATSSVLRLQGGGGCPYPTQDEIHRLRAQNDKPKGEEPDTCACPERSVDRFGEGVTCFVVVRNRDPEHAGSEEHLDGIVRSLGSSSKRDSSPEGSE